MKRLYPVVVLLVALFTIPVTGPATGIDTRITNRGVPVGLGAAVAGSLTGSGQSIDGNYQCSTSFYIENASNVQWTADVLIEAPNGTAVSDVSVRFPQPDWRPIAVRNPLNQTKTYLTDWYYSSGRVTIRASALDVFGVWHIDFEASNYVSGVDVGIGGGTLGETVTLQTTDTLAVRATTPWITGASVNLVLVDPSGTEWYRTSTAITGATTHEVPGFQYRKSLTISSSNVDGDLTNFPVLIELYDTDLHDSSKVQADGDDILFVQNGHILAHELELFSQNYNSTHAHLLAWVRANLSSTTDTTITMYYGNPIVGPQERPDEVWTDNYEAVWHLDESATDEMNTTVFYDSTSGGYDANQRETSRVNAKIVYGQDFDGSDDFITVNSTEGLNPSGSVTISGWFKLDSAFGSSSPKTMILVEKYLTASNNMHVALVGTDYGVGVPDGSMVFKVENSGATRYVWTSTTSWNAGWYYFTVYFNSSDTSKSKIFINGNDVTSGTTVGTLSTGNLGFSGAWGIGGGEADTNEIPSGSGFFDGRIDEVRIGLGSKATSWISTEYTNQDDATSFVTSGTAQQRTLFQNTFTKAMTGAAAGVWTARVFYNDTGAGVDNRTGLYERQFTVKHDSSLSLISPGDAISDSVSVRTAGEMLYVEVELTDDLTSGKVSGATVKMNWSASGSEYDVTLNDYGTGRYGIAMNTTDLGTNQRWALVVYSSHPYYNDATLTFYLDLYHPTELTYLNVTSTPYGQDFTATLVFRDTYDDTPITGATITFGNGTPVNVVAQGNGMYNISVSSGGLSIGDHWFIFNATKSGAYVNDASVNVTFTLRAHYTTASVSGDLTTPYGFDTSLTVTIIDTDTGQTVAIADVSSMTFTWSGGSHSENPATSFDVTLPTSSWAVGTKTVTLSVVMASNHYYAPDGYSFDVTIRNHYTSASVTGDFTTPWGFDTTVTIVIVDKDTGTELSYSDVSSVTFVTTHYGSQNPSVASSLTVQLDTDSWSVGDEAVTLQVTMTGNYDNPSDYGFTITIRKHYTTASVQGDLVTPWGYDTTVTVVVTDQDTGSNLGTSDVSSVTFVTSHYGSQSPTISGSLTFTLSTNSWSVGDEGVTLQVGVDTTKYEAPIDYSFTVTIRNHYTSATVSGDLETPWGFNTDVTVAITDKDTGSTLAASSVSWVYFDYAHYGDQNFTVSGSLSFTLSTSTWVVGDEPTTLKVSLLGDYDNPSDYDFTITIRNHHTSVTVSGDLTTPWGFDTTVTVVVTDTETGSTLSASDVSWANFDYATVGYTDENFTISGSLTLTLNTDSWAVGTESITLTVGLNGDYDNPTTYSFSITVRNHYTVASVSGDLTTPWGYKTTVTVVITDQDTGAILGASTVSSVDFDYATLSYTDDHFVISGSLELTLNTDTWAVGTESVTMTVTMNGDYDAPASHGFSITIRRHYTSVTVTGSLTSPYGNTTLVTVVVTDLDTDTTLSASTVSSIVFDPTHYANQTINPVTSLDIVLSTESWAVGTESVLIDVSMTANYYDPDDYTFNIEICALSTYLYHEPNDLIFPNGDSFKIIIRVNVSETGPYYGEMLTGLVAANFTVHNGTYNYPFTLHEISSGRFNLTIDGSYFPEGTYTITVEFNPVNATLDSSKLVITFQYRPARSEISSPDRAVTTPYDTDFDITLNFTDVDRNAGISGATITSEGVSIYDVTDLGGGQYRVTVNVSGMARGEYYYNITADKTGYEAQTIEFKVLIRAVYTSAIPTVNALDIPVGKDPIFYVDFTDLDHSVPIDDSAPFQLNCTWIHPIIWEYTADNRYRITFPTELDDPLQQNLFVTFTFSKGENYRSSSFNISVTVRTHNTDLRLVTAVEPTSHNANITIHLFYGDLDDQSGIWSEYVAVRVENETGVVTYYWDNETDSGEGYYIVEIPAAQFNSLGTKNFTIYFNWTGPVYSYQNKTIYVSGNIVGEDSKYTLLIAAEPTPYKGNMTYVFSYAELYSGEGITNSSYGGGNVHIWVVFPGISVDVSSVDIWEVDAVNQPGNYSIQFNTTIFGEVGVIYMEIHVDWAKGVSPFYTNRTDTITVRILSRDTLVSVIPPSPTSYGENATFTFIYYDVTGSTSAPIAYDDTKMTVWLDLTEYMLRYSDADKTFTVSFDTSQFGDIGIMYFYLNVTWAGSPYYGNQTMLKIDVTILERATQINFQAPSPTPYGDNVTFTVTYLDVAGSSSVGITDYTFTLYYGSSPIDSSYLEVSYGPSGDVTVELNTSYFSQPGTYELNASFVYTGTEHASDNWATRNLQVNYRPTILSSEPVGSVGYGRPLEIVLYYQDALTLDNIGSATTMTILNNTGTPWNYTVTWRPQYENYLMVVQTTGQSFNVGNQHTLHIRATYANVNPFYKSDDVYVEFIIRNRTSVLDLADAPLPVSYLEDCEFSVYYGDTDAGEGISGATISIYFSDSKIASSYYTVSSPSEGTYDIALNTTAFGGLGSYSITVVAQWPGGAPYHDDAQKTISVTVIERPTNVEIMSPPSSTKYLDNVTFTFTFTDTINGQVIDISSDNIILWGEGVQLGPDSFIMTQVGSVFEISINSTVLSPTLVTDYNLTISVDWNSTQAPYYADDVTSLRLTTVRRAMTIEVGAIETTPLNDNITLTFSVSDDDTGAPISDAIILFDCVEKHITQGANYWLTRGTGESAGTYTIEVDSSFFNATGDFHFELTVQWDPNASPYYANKTTIGIIGSVDLIWAVLSSDLPQPSSVQISQAVYVIVYYRDLDHGAIGVDPQKFTVRYLATGTEPTGLQITRISAGVYNISFSTIDITTTGSWTLNITAEAWPYTTSSVQPTFTVRVIETALSPLETSIQVNWTDTVRVWIDYKDLLHSTLVDSAYVHCTWGGQEVVFTESGTTPGRYYADIDTSLQDAGTWVVAITASKDRFATSITTVTLVVLSLPSQIVPIEPAGLSISTFRGEDTHITIHLLYIKGNSTFTIQDQYVNEINAVFEGNGRTYVFLYNGTSGFYEVTMPGTDTKDVNVGFYYFRVTAKMRNFNPASIQFALELKQTRTVLNLDYSSGTSQEMTRYYSEIVRITVNFTEAVDLSASLSNATVMWYISDIEVNGSMIEDPNHPGFYYTDLDTTIPGYGIWAITIRAIPDDPQFSNAVTSLTLTIKRIPTRVFSPVPLTVPWGWVGNLSFTYWDEIFDRPVTDANAFYSWGPYTGMAAIPLGNGTYLVPVDTTVLLPEIKWSITISFSKANFVEASGAVQLTLELIETDIEVYAPEQNRVEDSTRNLVVPMGDILNITLYYSDIEMYFGGIEGANLTADSELRGDTFSGGRPVSIVELGGGYYSFIFDTNQAFLYEYTNGTPVTGGSYRVIIGLKLDNRTTQEVTVRIRIIDVPTSVVASVQSASISLIHGDQITIDVFFNDTWHSAGVTADFMQAISNNEAVLGVQIVPGSVTGHYVVTLTAQGVGTAIVEIHLGRQHYSNVSLTYVVQVLPNQTDLLVQQATIIGLPISLFVIVLLALYVKVWSVPKRVRQINGQIKALRKGRIPKPVPDARGRAEILADLFNDTYADLGITRTPAQLPEESVQVEIPEMGELLMQLSILTNLSQEELDEFKSDISKMKLSEQAAFVKEVIHQEAIRTARREGKTVDEVLKDIEQLAKRRLGDMEGEAMYGRKEEPAGETLILRPEEPEVRPEVRPEAPKFEPEGVAPGVPAEPEVPELPADRLSPFELEELRKELEAKGVPAHEIDTIVEQAKNLPRDLVDELIRSLTGDEE